MSTTTMHFGPEWMRPKHQISKPSPPSPPPTAGAPISNASTYSALVTPAQSAPPERRDEVHPFRYSKEEMLRIYKEGGGKGGLGLEVERWEGVVREVETEPIGLREMGEVEKKLFTSPLNSDLRRRQSNDYLHLNTQNLERPRLNHTSSGSAAGSPLRERYGNLMTRRRDSTDQAPALNPRKLSLSGQAPLMSPRDTALPSPRGRVGFDGVFNGGDSWTARRRASEGLAKAAGVHREGGREDGRNSDIKEEEEEHSRGAEVKSNSNPVEIPPSNEGVTQQPENIETGMAQLSIESTGNQSISDLSASNSVAIGPPPGITDLASVEWSYLDPQGQIQGPFRADVMQKWHDDGYFTPDLLMKRTSLDTDWTPVGELMRRAGGGKIFLTPLTPSLPPGLLRRTDSPQHLYAEQTSFNGPFQPAPMRSLRSSTLDTYFGTGSNPSDSPGSSFGARFSNGSPDPSAFGGRAGQFGSGEIGGRLGGFPMSDSPARRSTLGENFVDSRSQNFGSNYNVNGAYSSNASPWPPSNMSMGPGFDSINTGPSSTDFQTGYSAHLGSGPGTSNSTFVDGLGNSAYRDYGGAFSAAGGQQSLAQAYSNRTVGGIPFNDSTQQQYPATLFTAQQQFSSIPDTFDQQATRPAQPPLNVQETVSSPWGAVDGVIPKPPGPFDAIHPTSANTLVNQPPSAPQPSPWGNPQLHKQTVPAAVDVVSSQVTTDTMEQEAESNTIIVAQIDGLSAEELLVVEPKSETELAPTQETISPSEPASEPAPFVIAAAPAPTTTKTRKSKQQSTSAQTASPEVPASQLAASPSSPQPPAVAPPKAPWAKDDDSKKSATSLREIQNAEAKKAEARKTAEREKERAARVAATTAPAEDVQPFTASWGLPTSQAGKVSAAPQTKETTSAGVSASPPVWTQPGKPPVTKKTMKEIQEEEERRKKVAVKENAASVTTRRGYAESTTKSSTVPLQNNAWTTVGPSGKAVVSPSPARPQPAIATPAASSTSVPRTNGTISRPTTSTTPSVAKPAPAAAKIDDFPVTPSHEFLKWLNDNLKGLNNSVNFEEIMSMLLSFPLDPDASTVEIISDLIYANSTTLDGRRFASEFVSRRKADATARSKAGVGVGNGKPVSIADVVKAQPKPQAQSEWGGFKVVNKKKKSSGRS